MEHLFSQIPEKDIERSVFDRKFTHKTTFNSGDLVPVFVDEILPGDSMTLDCSSFGRLLSPTVSPVMDNAYLNVQFFYVPNRVVWDNWKKFQGEQRNPDDSVDYLVPTIRSGETGFGSGSLADYFGINIDAPYFEVNSLPFRMYNLIYNELYRDENLIDSVTVPYGDSDDIDNYTILKRGKRHDYFTSCLPFAQKFNPISIPLIGDAPVVGNGMPLGLMAYDNSNPAVLKNYGLMHTNSFAMFSTDGYGQLLSDTTLTGQINIGNQVGVGVNSDKSYSGLKADLSGVTAVAINTLRTAVQMQRLMEAYARGGTRYAEILRSLWNVVPDDASLQRPQYLGGFTQRMNLSVVPQTSESDTTKQGNLSAYGLFASSNHTFSHTFTEHGFIIGLANIYTDMTYQQGTERMWSRQTRFDYYMPTLAHLGEQAVLNKEIYTQGNTYDSVHDTYAPITTNVGTELEPVLLGDDDVFGYQERWAEYRYKPSLITGQIRSSLNNSLDVWHYAQEFENLPTLSEQFIEENPAINRTLAVQNSLVNEFIFDFEFQYKCARRMPVYSVPGLMDHF